MTWDLERRDAVAVLYFNRPPDNQARLEDLRELDSLLADVSADESIALVVLASRCPGYFIAHADREEVARFRRGEPIGDTFDRWRITTLRLENIAQPTLALIDGQAWGGGCELALACTFRLGSSRAHLALHEVSVGAMPGAGGTQRLPRLIGPSRAARLVLSGQPVDAAAAAELGLLDAVIGGPDLLAEALTWAQRIVANPRASLVAAKKALVSGQRLPLLEGLAAEQELFMKLLTR
jgi:enoyl-CoA hydratase/carnithine racemase